MKCHLNVPRSRVWLTVCCQSLWLHGGQGFEVSAVASVLAASGGNEIGPVTELLAHLSCEVQVRHVDGDANS